MRLEVYKDLAIPAQEIAGRQTNLTTWINSLIKAEIEKVKIKDGGASWMAIYNGKIIDAILKSKSETEIEAFKNKYLKQ